MSESSQNPLHSAAAPSEGREPAEQLQQLWEEGAAVDVHEFLDSTGGLSPEELAAVLYVDQHQRWNLGERTTAESYLQRFPEVCADADAAVDLIFHEFLLREQQGECPEAREYTERFPLYAEALRRQLAFHRLLTDSEALRAGELPSTAAPTASAPAYAPPPTAQAAQTQIGLVDRGRLSSSREVQTLLRQRLRVFAIGACVGFVVLAPMVWSVLNGVWGVVIYATIIAETGAIAVLLASQRQISISALRWIEVCLFGGVLLYFSWEQVQLFQSGALLELSGYSWIGPVVAARSLSWSWAVTLIVYGIWIPNTARRLLVAVAVMVFSFLAINLALALSATDASSSTVTGFMLSSTTHITAAAVIALLGAYRIRTLQHAVSEARRLGPYRLMRPLGSGGMGDVYLAEHALLRRPCALKLIRPEHSRDAHFMSRFEREVQTMATLTHPNTVRVYDYGIASDGTFYYAMEYLPGLSLQELVSRYGPLPPERAVFLLRQVCGALQEAHGVGLVHRDIKPANILVSYAGGIFDVAKLLDFGLVRNEGAALQAGGLTGIGAIAGTPAFMSPEQAAGAAIVDQRSDIYSLGAVAYFVLTGRPPFVHATSVETMAAHLNAIAVPPSDRQSSVPSDLEAVVLRCLEKGPERRFADVQALDCALAQTSCAERWSIGAATEWWREFADASPA